MRTWGQTLIRVSTIDMMDQCLLCSYHKYPVLSLLYDLRPCTVQTQILSHSSWYSTQFLDSIPIPLQRLPIPLPCFHSCSKSPVSIPFWTFQPCYISAPQGHSKALHHLPSIGSRHVQAENLLTDPSIFLLPPQTHHLDVAFAGVSLRNIVLQGLVVGVIDLQDECSRHDRPTGRM